MTEGGIPDLETVVERLDRVLAEVEEHPDARVREWVVEALGALERLHSEGLRRMATLVEQSPGGLRPALEDPVVANLLFLHGVTGDEGSGRSVVAVEEGGRGPGGQDRVRLDSGETVSFLPESSLRRLERRLRDADEEEPEEPEEPVPGRENGTPARTGSASRWVKVGPVAEIEGPELHGYMAAGQPVLLLEAREGIRAYRNACPDSILPLHLGRREEGEVVCPWHGCRFDAATGERRDGEGPGLRPVPLRTDGGTIRVEVP